MMKIKKGLNVAKAYVPHMYKIHENEKKTSYHNTW